MEIFYRNAFSAALDLLYPRNIYCLCCGDAMENTRIHGLCDRCIEKIDWNTKNPFRRQMDNFAFDDVYPCCTYGYYPRKIISGFKLTGRPYGAEPLGRLLGERLLQEYLSAPILAAVPMHSSKEAQRGFNQAELLAKEASIVCGAAYIPRLLKKTKATRSMRLSDGNTRKTLLHDEFAVDPDLVSAAAGRHVVLVDDVVTTGSTADACARVLKEAGASKVSVLCFACSSDHIFMDIQGANDV